MVDHPESARQAVDQEYNHLINLSGCHISNSQYVAHYMFIATLNKTQARMATSFGGKILESGDEELFSCLEAFLR